MPLDDCNVQSIADRLPDLPWAREELLISSGLPESFAHALALSPRFDLLLEMLALSRTAKRTRIVGWVFYELLKALRRKGVPVDRVSDADLRQLLGLFMEERFYREGLEPVIVRLASHHSSGGDGALTEILKEDFPEVARGETPVDIREEELAPLFDKTGAQPFAGEAQRWRSLMRLAMARYRGVASGQEVFKAVAGWCRKHPVRDERGGD